MRRERQRQKSGPWKDSGIHRLEKRRCHGGGDTRSVVSRQRNEAGVSSAVRGWVKWEQSWLLFFIRFGKSSSSSLIRTKSLFRINHEEKDEKVKTEMIVNYIRNLCSKSTVNTFPNYSESPGVCSSSQDNFYQYSFYCQSSERVWYH